MITGLAITPIVVGRIGIGEIVEQGGKRLPKRLDHIVITKDFQTNGAWNPHPEMDKLLEAQKVANIAHPDKLRSIPVRIMFDTPENNFRAEYTCFDDKSRPICTGNGAAAKRRDSSGIKDVECPGADICAFGKDHRCKQLGRLIIGMESSFEADPLVGFMFRTTSFNSIRALTYRLKMLAAATGNKIAGMPCNLVMKARSTAASYRKPIFFLDLEPVGGLLKAAAVAAEYHKTFEAAGLSRIELEKAVTAGLAQSAFFEGGEDGEEVIEEFFQPDVDDDEVGENVKVAACAGTDTGTGALPGVAGQLAALLCTAEQIAAIERLCSEHGKEKNGLLQWLGKPVDTPLATLTADEAKDSIAALMRKPAPALAAAPAESLANPVAEKQLAVKAETIDPATAGAVPAEPAGVAGSEPVVEAKPPMASADAPSVEKPNITSAEKKSTARKSKSASKATPQENNTAEAVSGAPSKLVPFSVSKDVEMFF